MSNLVSKDFWGNMESTDFAIPHVKIGQPMSKKGEMGKYNFSNGAAMSEIKGVKLLVPHKTRVLYGKEFTDKARCGSDDFHVPSTRIENPISPSCLTCFAKEWGEDDPRKLALAKELNAKRPNLPLCKETYNPMLVDGEGKPFYIQFQGVALGIVGKELMSRLRYEFGRVPPYCVAFDMGTALDPKSPNKVYIPTFSNFRLLEGEDAERMANLWQMYVNTAAQMLAEDHARMDQEKDVDAIPF